MQDYIPQEKDINDRLDTVTVKQFDNNSRFLHVKFKDVDLTDVDDNSFDLADCTTALYIKPESDENDEDVNFVNGTIESAESGIVTFLLPGGVTQVVGRYTCEIWIYGGDEETQPIISSKPFTLVVEKSIRNDSAIEASPSMSALDARMVELTAIRARMDAITAMADAGEIPAGTVEAEVADARAGKGATYSSLGSAVRASVQSVDAFLNAARFAESPISSDFDNLPNNVIRACGVYNVAESDGVSGHIVLAHAPMLGQLTGLIVTFGRADERKNGDTQLFISWGNRDVLFRQYNRVAEDNPSWSEWKTFSDQRINRETFRQYPDIIHNAWFSGGKTVLDLPYNYIFYIANDFSATYADVGLPCNGNGTLTKVRPLSNTATNTGFTVYTFTVISNGDTAQYYAYAKDNQDIASLVWHRYNDAPANPGINGLGLESKRVVFLGDSIVSGLGTSDFNGGSDATGNRQIQNDVLTWYRNTGTKCWVNRMISYLTATFNGVTACNNGVGGLTTAQLLRNLDSLLPDDDGNTPDIAVISIGTNDRASANKTTAIVNPLREIIRRVKAKGVQPVIMTNMPMFGRDAAGYVYTSAAVGENAEHVRSAIALACNLEGVHCYDMMAAFSGYAEEHGLSPYDYMRKYNDNRVDVLHPNDLGHEIMFRLAKMLLGVPSSPGVEDRMQTFRTYVMGE